MKTTPSPLAAIDLLEMQVLALELHRDRIEILDAHRDGLAGRRVQLGRVELVILVGDGQRDGVLRVRGRRAPPTNNAATSSSPAVLNVLRIMIHHP